MRNSMVRQGLRYAAFILRGNRVFLLLWTIVIVLLTLSQAVSFADLYPDVEERQLFALSMQNPAFVAMLGKPYGVEDYSLGSLMVGQTIMLTFIMMAVVNILFINRSIALAEEKGLTEMIFSRSVNRRVMIAVPVSLSLLYNITLSILLGLGLSALEIESIDCYGSILYGATAGASGLFFASISLLMFEITGKTKQSLLLSVGILCLSYIVRAIGDVYDSNFSLFSPIGLLQASQIFVLNRWYPVIFTTGASILLYLVACCLDLKRDYGTGWIHFEAKTGNASFRTPLHVLVHSHKKLFLGCAIVELLFGLSFGYAMNDIEGQIGQNEWMSVYLQGPVSSGIKEQFIRLMSSLVAVLTVIPVSISLLTIKTEELSGRMEVMETYGLTRSALFRDCVVYASLSGIMYISLFSISLWIGATCASEIIIGARVFFEPLLLSMVAILFILGMFSLLIGINVKADRIAWAAFAFCALDTYIGPALGFNDSIISMSPFSIIAKGGFDSQHSIIWWLLGLTVIFYFCGSLAYKHRNLINEH